MKTKRIKERKISYFPSIAITSKHCNTILHIRIVKALQVCFAAYLRSLRKPPFFRINHVYRTELSELAEELVKEIKRKKINKKVAG